MKKKSAIFFVLLFAFTMAFSFGISNADVKPRPEPEPERPICCYIPASGGCSASQGHWVPQLHSPAICVRTGGNMCDIPPQCW